MRNILAFLGAAMLVFLGVGYYLGWYHINREPTPTGHSHLQVDIDQDKIGKDVKKGADKVKDAIDKNAPDTKSSMDTKPLSGINPASPFTPIDSNKTSFRDEMKQAARDAARNGADMAVDGWFAPDKK